MNIFKQVERQVKAIIGELQAEGKLPPNLSLDKVEAAPPREASHGDVATNVAMVLAGQAGKNPREIAGLVAEKLKNATGIDKVEIAGAGFINLVLSPSVWQAEMLEILAQKRAYGDSKIGAGKKVNVEYVSANPTGPMHIGHARYIYGDAIVLLLRKTGYNVTAEYYINDAGSQVEKLAQSAYLRYSEACGEVIAEIPAGLYPGDYLVPIGQALFAKYGKDLLDKTEEIYLPLVKDFTLAAVMEIIKADLASLGIEFDVFASEQAIRDAGKVEAAVADLDAKGLLYEGFLEAPKGKPVPDDWEPRLQTLFRSTQFGDDLDRPVKKSDGAWTYFAPDIAYQRDKIERGYEQLIMLLGVDHGGYVKRLKAAVSALSGGKVDLEIKLCQLVKFMRDGEPIKMSKRAGTFVTVREVVDEVGKDVFRFIMLTRKNDVPLDFDFAKVMEKSRENPVFYVQYAHARARSISRNVAAEMPEAFALAEKPNSELLAKLNHPAELALIRFMANYPRMIESAAIALEPHRIAFYLQELAAQFHALWNQGNGDAGLRFMIREDAELTAARVALAHAVSFVIASGLNVLGVEPVEEMR